jgi:hypothetical protein
MIILKKYNNENIINKLYKKHFNETLIINDKIIYNLYDNKNIVGYVIYKIKNADIYLDWIYAPNYGKIFMKKLERKFKKEKYNNILLNVSIDPTENINIVMKRINFYISLQYKVYNIQFREKYGPLLYMKKILKK